MRALATLLLAALVAATSSARAQEAPDVASAAIEPERRAKSEAELAAAPETEEEETEAPPAAPLEPDEASAPSSGASSALGLITILGAVGTAASLGVWLEREDNVGLCTRYAMEDPPTLGCLNTGALRDQRDVGIGLTIGFGALTLGAAIAWALVVATTPAPPTETGLTCAPGVLSFACAGRF